jgi:hypothetical protein
MGNTNGVLTVHDEVLYTILVILLIYVYYKICKWLTYDWFRSEESGQSVIRKAIGVILLLPIIVFVIGALIAGMNGSTRSSPHRAHDQNDDEDEGYYQAQVRGGTTWLNVGGPRNEAGAINSVDYEKSRNPEKQYRVVQKNSRGKVIGTVYFS